MSSKAFTLAQFNKSFLRVDTSQSLSNNDLQQTRTNIKTWIGTQTQYDDIPAKDPNTIYFITT